MLGRSLPAESRKGLARDVSETFVMRAGLVYDVTDTDYFFLVRFPFKGPERHYEERGR